MASSDQFDDYRLARRLRWLNRFIQTLLIVVLIAGLNFLALRVNLRWDISENKIHTLSPESIAHLEQLESQLLVTVAYNRELTLPSGRLVQRDLGPILDSFSNAIKRAYKDEKISVALIDPMSEPERFSALVSQFGFDGDNGVFLESGIRRRVIPLASMYEKTGGGGIVFNGEQVLMSGILDVTNPTSKKIYFTQGHGEMQLVDTDRERGLSEVYSFLENQTISAEVLDLSLHVEVPEDADILFIASPQAEFRGEDVEKIRDYLDKRNGSVILILEPFRNHNLESVMFDWGILSDNAVIMDPGPDFQTTSGSLILRRFAEHPITQGLIDNQLYVYSSQPRPVRSDPGATRIAGVDRTELIGTSETSWIEMGFSDERLPVFTPGRDVGGPIPVGVIAERREAESLGLNLKGGKLIVLGDASILSNERFALYGNRMLMTNMIHWCLEQDYLLSIPPNELTDYRLSLSEADLNLILMTLLSIPIGIALLGLVIRVSRR